MKKNGKLEKEIQALSHPRDRKVRQLQKKEKRMSKMAKRKQTQNDIKIKKAMRFLWFRTQCIALGRTTSPLNEEEAVVLTKLYISRHQEELQIIKSRSNPPIGRIKEIELLYREEHEAFQSSGLEIPVVTSSDEIEILTTIWDGLPETSSVLNTEFVHDRETSVECLNAIKKQLMHLDNVREAAKEVLPRRMTKKIKSIQKQKTSVKAMDNTSDIRRRTASKHIKKQKEMRKSQYEAALAQLRESDV